MANNNNIRPDIDFENDLWKVADELRGVVAENQYNDFVLSLIFIKHLSRGVYMLPLEATWEYLQENAEMDEIKVKVDQDTWN